MDPLWAVGIAVNLMSVFLVVLRRINGEYIGNAEDIILSFKKPQAQRIRQLQSDIISIQKGNRIAAGDHARQAHDERLGEALHTYGEFDDLSLSLNSHRSLNSLSSSAQRL